MVSAIGPSGIDWSTSAATGPSGIDWSDSSTSHADLSDFFSSAISDFTSTFSAAATSQLNGLVNNAADAAAKRLGINLPSSSSSSTSSSNKSSSKTTTTSSGPNIATRNIDQLLATLDGHPPAPVTSTSTSTKFDLNSFLGSLDKITAGTSVSKAPATPSGKNFSISSYLATLDQITARPAPVVNVTA